MRSFADVLADALRSEPSSPRAEQERDRSPDAEAAAAASMAEMQAIADMPSWSRTLGVAAWCSEDDVRKAFRRRAFETHPDRPGGSHEAFLAVKSAHDAALEAARDRRRGPVSFAAPSYVATRMPVRTTVHRVEV